MAPEGAQNAPGDTIETGEGDGVGEDVGIGAEAAISNSSDFRTGPILKISATSLTLKDILKVSDGTSKQESKSSGAFT